jgi:hypothetical protein
MADNVESLFDPKDPDSIEPNEFTAALRVASPTVPLDDVTRRLGPPTRGHSVGDPMGRHAAPRRWHNTVWLREGSGGNTALEPLIEELVSFAEGYAPALTGRAKMVAAVNTSNSVVVASERTERLRKGGGGNYAS